MLDFILYLLAFVCFALAAFGVVISRVNLAMLGVALLVLAYFLIPAAEKVTW